jgi:GDP-D-mannose dehydratase
MTVRKALVTGITGQDGSNLAMLEADLREAGIDPDRLLKAAAG